MAQDKEVSIRLDILTMEMDEAFQNKACFAEPCRVLANRVVKLEVLLDKLTRTWSIK